MEFDGDHRMGEREKEYFRKKVGMLHLLAILGMMLYIFGGGTIYGYAAFALVMIVGLREDVPFREAVGFRRKMTVPAFVMLLFASLVIHPLIVVSGGVLQPIFDSIGVHIETTRQFFVDIEGDYEPTPLPDILMGGFIAPIFEELICRGYIAGSYYRTSGSKMHAIIFSGIIFGSMHCQVEAHVPFIVGGFLFAYIALEYGIVWSAVFHSVNNFLVGEVLGQRVLIIVPVESRYPIYCAFSAVIAVVCIIIAIVKRRSISEYISENACEREHFRLTVTSLPLWVMMAAFIFFTFNKF